MKIWAVFILTILWGSGTNENPDLDRIRQLFAQSATFKASADQLLKTLSDVDESSPPVLICYKGAAEMMQAKYGLNPINKLKRFKKGKLWIEKAVKKDPGNPEVRYLRFAIQTNLPSFLSYDDHIQLDKTFLIDNLTSIKDKELKQNIVNYMANTKYCSTQERKGFSYDR
jgi:hypothetical protein